MFFLNAGISGINSDNPTFHSTVPRDGHIRIAERRILSPGIDPDGEEWHSRQTEKSLILTGGTSTGSEIRRPCFVPVPEKHLSSAGVAKREEKFDPNTSSFAFQQLSPFPFPSSSPFRPRPRPCHRPHPRLRNYFRVSSKFLSSAGIAKCGENFDPNTSRPCPCPRPCPRLRPYESGRKRARTNVHVENSGKIPLFPAGEEI